MKTKLTWIVGHPEKPGLYLVVTGSGQIVLDEYKGGGARGWNYGYVSHHLPVPASPVTEDVRTGKTVECKCSP
jgi:hypothetical protein